MKATRNLPLIFLPALLFVIGWSSPAQAFQGEDIRATTGGPGQAQIADIDRKCILQVLGRIPSGLADLTALERQLVRELCLDSGGDSQEVLSSGVDLRTAGDTGDSATRDTGNDAGADELDRYWSQRIQEATGRWSNDLSPLQQERAELEEFWSQQLAWSEEAWQQDMNDLATDLNFQEDQWASELAQINRRISLIVSPSRERDLLAQRRRTLLSQIDSERLQLEQAMEDRQLEIAGERSQLERQRSTELADLDREIAQMEHNRDLELQQLQEEWAAARRQADQSPPATDQPAEGSGYSLLGGFGQREPAEDSPTEAASDFQLVNQETATTQQGRGEPVADEASNAEPASNESEVRSNEVKGPQRGFFINGDSLLAGTSMEQALEPTTLALLGILITLGTTAITLVRGR